VDELSSGALIIPIYERWAKKRRALPEQERDAQQFSLSRHLSKTQNTRHSFRLRGWNIPVILFYGKYLLMR